MHSAASKLRFFHVVKFKKKNKNTLLFDYFRSKIPFCCVFFATGAHSPSGVPKIDPMISMAKHGSESINVLALRSAVASAVFGSKKCLACESLSNTVFVLEST